MWWHGKDGEKVEARVMSVLPECVAHAGRPTITHVFQVAAVMAPLLIKVRLYTISQYMHQSVLIVL